MTLSHREEQLSALIQQAKSNKVIAYELGLTTGTVKEYLFRLYKKVGVENRTALAMWSSNRHSELKKAA